MLNSIFQGLFETNAGASMPVGEFFICLLVSLLLGAALAWVYAYKNKYTQSFIITLALLPAAVCVVIMMVNGNLGAGVAVAGVFGLVRFRSVPGTAREIGAIFLAMGAGLTAGMGYIGYAVAFTVILGAVSLLYSRLGYWMSKRKEEEKVLHITIPEDLDYTGIFNKILEKYTRSYELVSVKTTNMGSLFKLTYHIVLRDASWEKDFIDKLRCRNGNLEIGIARMEAGALEL